MPSADAAAQWAQGFSGLASSTWKLPTSRCTCVRLWNWTHRRCRAVTRSTGCPEKLANNPLNLDHPVWADDNDFDADRHLHRIGFPPPGGQAELSQICGHIASLPWTAAGHLWAMWVMEELLAAAR